MSQKHHEMTFRGFVLGAVLAILFVAANVYLGLTVGLTFATSIPAAVISMACLSTFKNANILENNIVQTIASTGGTLSTIVFILPGLAMAGLWTGFPFWQSTLVTMIGGIFGVLFTIPLRRALVIDSHLPYPEGTAAAAVLRAPAQQKLASNRETPLRDIIFGGALSFIFSLLAKGFNVLASEISAYGKIGASYVTGTAVDFSFSLVGAGYLIGIRIGLTILAGVLLAWLVGVPLLSLQGLSAHPDVSSYAQEIWKTKIRYIGVGTLTTAAVWSIIQLTMPVIKSVRTSLANASKHISTEPHEKDIPIFWVSALAVFLLFPLFGVFAYFLYSGNTGFSTGFILSLVIVCTFLAVLIGFIVAASSGYMAGLVGSSNSPISGLGIIGVIIISLVLNAIFNASSHPADAHSVKYIIAMALFSTSAVVTMASISNDNLQDLQTGYLIKATPWKQQVALIFGVIVASFILSPILNQLYQAYGFVGSLPHANMDPSKALSAPQATVMTTLAQGIIGKTIVWNYMLGGIGFGILILIINGILRLSHIKPISIFSIGLGIYLPPSINIPLFFGSLVSYFVSRYMKSREIKSAIEQRGTLFASGLIVGDALFGILLAIAITASSSQSPMSLVPASFKPIAIPLGIIVYVAIIAYFYTYVIRPYRKR